MPLAAWFVVIELVWIVGIAIWVVLEKRSPTSTIAWTLALVFLPAIGIPIYLLVGPRRLERHRRRYRLALEGIGQRLESLRHEEPIPPDTLRQARLVVGVGCTPPLPASRLDLYQTAESAFRAIREAIDGAHHHLHLEFYIWEPDPLGVELLDRLVARARDGVEVRVLIDAIGSPRLDARFFAPLLAAGGEFARFNPPRLRLARWRFVNFRTHRKIVVADGSIGFTGGMNVSARHASGSDSEPPWRDTMIRLEGAAVAGLQAVFLENWHSARRTSPKGASYLPAHRGEANHWVQVVASGPDRDVYPIHELIVSAISAADERVWIVNPYIVPDDALVTALRTAAHRGADVRLIVPRQGDSRVVAAAMRSFWDELLPSGIRIYEYLPGMHHAKTMVIDDELALVGTANLDNRSFRLNFEVAVAIHGGPAVSELATAFERDLAQCATVRSDRTRTLPLLPRLAEATARLFAPIL